MKFSGDPPLNGAEGINYAAGQPHCEDLRQTDRKQTDLWKAKAPKEQPEKRGISQAQIQSKAAFCAVLLFFLGGENMATLGNPRDYRIITNNPLVVACMEGKGNYTIDFQPDKTYREILVMARDLIHIGHSLYTHPLAGSVKPNENPYKSLIVSCEAHGFDADDAQIMSSAVTAYDKFRKIDHEMYSEQVRKDFQLIDYTLLAGSIGFDAVAGLSNMKK